MTNTIKENHLSGVLKRLRIASELDLTVQHNASGFSLLLMNGSGNVPEMLAFSNSKRGIHDAMLCATRVLDAIRIKH